MTARLTASLGHQQTCQRIQPLIHCFHRLPKAQLENNFYKMFHRWYNFYTFLKIRTLVKQFSLQCYLKLIQDFVLGCEENVFRCSMHSPGSQASTSAASCTYSMLGHWSHLGMGLLCKIKSIPQSSQMAKSWLPRPHCFIPLTELLLMMTTGLIYLFYLWMDTA